MQTCPVAPDRNARDSCHNGCERDDPQNEKYFAEETGLPLRQFRRLRGEMYREHYEPDYGRLTNRFHGSIVERSAACRGHRPAPASREPGRLLDSPTQPPSFQCRDLAATVTIDQRLAE